MKRNQSNMRPHRFKVEPPPPPPLSENLRLSNDNLNVSAGGIIYERAKSRRERHRSALMSSEAYDAIPLGKSGKCGPGRIADTPGDVLSDKIGRDIRGGDEEKAKELMYEGRGAAARALKRSRTTSRIVASGKGAGGAFDRRPDDKLVRKMEEIKRECSRKRARVESKYTSTAPTLNSRAKSGRSSFPVNKESKSALMPVKKKEAPFIPCKSINWKRKIDKRAEKSETTVASNAPCPVKREVTDEKVPYSQVLRKERHSTHPIACASKRKSKGDDHRRVDYNVIDLTSSGPPEMIEEAPRAFRKSCSMEKRSSSHNGRNTRNRPRNAQSKKSTQQYRVKSEEPIAETGAIPQSRKASVRSTLAPSAGIRRRLANESWQPSIHF